MHGIVFTVLSLLELLPDNQQLKEDYILEMFKTCIIKQEVHISARLMTQYKGSLLKRQSDATPALILSIK